MPTPKTKSEILTEIERNSEVINGTLWYVNPKVIEMALNSFAKSLRMKQMHIGENVKLIPMYEGYNTAVNTINNKINELLR